MKMSSLLALTALPAILAACTATPTAPPMPDPMPPESASCNHDAAQGLVGQPATQANIERARELAGARTARVIKPGQMVTMEYIPGRLNIHTDENNRIKSVRCG